MKEKKRIVKSFFFRSKLTRYASKDKGTTEDSPNFRFFFPAVKKTFIFAFQMKFNGEKDKEESEDFGLYLMNRNQVKKLWKYKWPPLFALLLVLTLHSLFYGNLSILKVFIDLCLAKL